MRLRRTKEDFEKAAKESQSLAAMCKALGLKPCGGNYIVMHNTIENYGIDISHFRGQGWNVGLRFRPMKQKPLYDILVNNSTYQSPKLRNRLLKEKIKEHICECCKLTQWNDHPIPLELHHINGNNKDNRLENLMLLCPNCHALTNTYRGKNNKCASRPTSKALV